MASLADSLPDDVDALRAIALATIAERDAAIAERDTAIVERDEAIARNDRLRHLLHKANDALYGSKSERLAKLPPSAQSGAGGYRAGDRQERSREDKKIRAAFVPSEAPGQQRLSSPPTCRASTKRLCPRTRTVRAAELQCMSSAKRHPSGWT